MNCLEPNDNLWELVTENQLAFLGYRFSSHGATARCVKARRGNKWDKGELRKAACQRTTVQHRSIINSTDDHT